MSECSSSARVSAGPYANKLKRFKNMNLNPIPFIVEQLVAAKNDLGRESIILSQSFKCLLLLIATVTSVVGSQFVMQERIGCHGDDDDIDKSNVEMHCLTYCYTIQGVNSLHPGHSVTKC